MTKIDELRAQATNGCRHRMPCVECTELFMEAYQQPLVAHDAQTHWKALEEKARELDDIVDLDDLAEIADALAHASTLHEEIDRLKGERYALVAITDSWESRTDNRGRTYQRTYDTATCKWSRWKRIHADLRSEKGTT